MTLYVGNQLIRNGAMTGHANLILEKKLGFAENSLGWTEKKVLVSFTNVVQKL